METEKKTEIGREGEREARVYLEKREYNILHTNWRWHHYELDIISCIPTGGGIIMSWILWPRRRASWWWSR